MSHQTRSTNFLRAVAELFGIVLMRFRPLPRVWAIWLTAMNGAALMFVSHPEAQVTLAVVAVAVVLQALLYQRLGFVRVLGIAHLMWVPMLLWFADRLPGSFDADPTFGVWMLVLMATNFVSLVIDAADVARFFRGEKAPHYAWKRSPE